MIYRLPSRFKRYTALIILCGGLLLLGGVELISARQTAGLNHWAGPLWAAVLVVCVFGTVYLLIALAPGPAAPGVAVATAMYGVLALAASTLAFCWLTYWVTGYPVRGDALEILKGSPVQASLHLISSDPLIVLLLLAMFAVLLAVAYVTVLLSRRAAPLLSRTARVLMCVLFAGIGWISASHLASAGASGATFATLIESQRSYFEADTKHFSCTLAPAVARTPAAGGTANGTPVIVIVMESLRADLLTRYRDAMPNLAALADHAVVFDRAWSTSTHTNYATLALWYSQYPLRHTYYSGYPVKAIWRGLSSFEYFKLHGYDTGYFSSQNEKWAEMINWLDIPGVDSFFDSEHFEGSHWENPDDVSGLSGMISRGFARSGKIADSTTLDVAAHWIDAHVNDPIFVGINLQNTHYNYYIPEHASHPYLPDKLGFRNIYGGWPQDQAPTVHNRYLNAAHGMDAALGSFIKRLQVNGVWDRAIVLVVGDHGEAFYEHGGGNHSGPAYDEVARTVAVMKLPKGDTRNGTHFERPVSHIDFVPTLVEAAGMKPWPGFQGEPVWQRAETTPLYLSVNAFVKENSIVRWPFKLLARDYPAPEIELYDLQADPSERTNLAAKRQDVALPLLRNLRAWEHCQLSYYADKGAYASLQPPIYWVDSALTAPASLPPAAALR